MKEIEKIKENVLQLQYDLIEDWDVENEETDSLLEDYTRKYDKFITDELSYYYRLL